MSLDLMKSYGTNLTTFGFKEVSQHWLRKVTRCFIFTFHCRIICLWFTSPTMTHRSASLSSASTSAMATPSKWSNRRRWSSESAIKSPAKPSHQPTISWWRSPTGASSWCTSTTSVIFISMDLHSTSQFTLRTIICWWRAVATLACATSPSFSLTKTSRVVCSTCWSALATSQPNLIHIFIEHWEKSFFFFVQKIIEKQNLRFFY